MFPLLSHIWIIYNEIFSNFTFLGGIFERGSGFWGQLKGENGALILTVGDRCKMAMYVEIDCGLENFYIRERSLFVNFHFE